VVYCASNWSISLKQLPSAPVLKSKSKFQRQVFSELVTDIKHRKVRDILIKPDNHKIYYVKDDGVYRFSNYDTNNEFWRILLNTDDIHIDIEYDQQFDFSNFVSYVVMILLIGSIVRSIATRGFTNLSGMNKSSFDIQHHIDTVFEDVQGIDDAKDELEEIVDFLKEPEKYTKSGAQIPKGALLIGSPGTGKTLLARAIAGESSVPFIQVSASSFVEMFVGVGAKRVRDIFAEAKRLEPCIIFIDEIDAIGKKRSTAGTNGNDEREQTINQLLTEMDGFTKSKIVVIAATNRVDILDEALLRSGRFDRKINVKLPDVIGREKILKVHSKDKILSENVSLRQIARQTMGFSGADLANILNECAIRAAKNNEDGVITNDIVEDTYQRLVVGTKGTTIMSTDMKKLTAYHEAGHALIGALMPSYDKVRKVSIIPRGNAGGITFFQPDNEEFTLQTKDYMLCQIKVCLGGYAAEEIVFGKENVTTGASSELMRVYDIAHEMVTCYGFGTSLGKLSVSNCTVSEETLRMIENEIKLIVSLCYDDTIHLLKKHCNSLNMLAHTLIEEEILDGEYVYSLLKQ
jgi:cell division protease FtsH